MKILDGLNNTDKIYIVVVVECLLYLIYHSKHLYLLFAGYSNSNAFIHIPGASWVPLLLWLDLWIFCGRAPSGVQYEWKRHHPRFHRQDLSLVLD